jgi:serine/threonine protein kinase
LADTYRIERELGAGGMATVYLAEDQKPHRQVAVKVLRPELAAVIGADRFLAEIRTTANLQHPHILALHDSGMADGFLFYVMPYIDGESLRERLTREKQLPVPDAVRIATEVASALGYAHSQRVIHRDIKPENILLHDGTALVADFGIALAATRAGGTRMTETGMSLGTPHYMSPEQAMGEREITPRSDIYGLGAVLYEMLTGEPPFTGPTAQAIVAKVMTSDPVPPHELRRGASAGRARRAHGTREAPRRPVRIRRRVRRRARRHGQHAERAEAGPEVERVRQVRALGHHGGRRRSRRLLRSPRPHAAGGGLGSGLRNDDRPPRLSAARLHRRHAARRRHARLCRLTRRHYAGVRRPVSRHHPALYAASRWLGHH